MTTPSPELRPARPHVAIDPAMQFGRPHVRDVAVEAITGLFAAGETVTVVRGEYGLTREDFLVACWYAGLYGTRSERKWLGAWAVFAGKLMWHGHWSEVSDPPEKPPGKGRR